MKENTCFILLHFHPVDAYSGRIITPAQEIELRLVCHRCRHPAELNPGRPSLHAAIGHDGIGVRHKPVINGDDEAAFSEQLRARIR